MADRVESPASPSSAGAPAGQRNGLVGAAALGAALLCSMVSFALSVIESRVELDPHHWGLMYANALDLAHGAVPYRDFHVPYGILTTLIQSFALRLGGESVVAIGAVTGACNSLNILLSFFIWRRIAGPRLAGLAAVLMFLVHPIIASPWPNYFAYFFVLVTVLSLLRPGLLSALIAGTALGLSFLARESSLASTASAVGAFLLYEFLREAEAAGRWRIVWRALLVTLGFSLVAGSFLAWLIHAGTLGDWRTFSGRTLEFYWSNFGGLFWMVARPGVGILTGRTRTNLYEVRSLLYSLTFLAAAAGSFGLLRTLKLRAAGPREAATFLLAVLTLSGFAQSAQHYEVWRLQCAASLGLGLLLISLGAIAARLTRGQRTVLSLGGLMVVLHLAASMAFTPTTSTYQQWNPLQIVDGLRGSRSVGWPRTVPMFRGMWWDSTEAGYYQNLKATLDSCSGHVPYLVNLSFDSFVPLLTPGLKRVQRCPYYLAGGYSRAVYPEDQAVVDSLIQLGRAVVVVDGVRRVPPGYEPVLRLPVPARTFIFFGLEPEMVIAMPRPKG